jgi:hypothetical protein
MLQLIYNALVVPYPEYAATNYKMFKKSNGMSAIFGVLNTTFIELKNRKEEIIEDEQYEK